jgi:hypothetical protein
MSVTDAMACVPNGPKTRVPALDAADEGAVDDAAGVVGVHPDARTATTTAKMLAHTPRVSMARC